MIIGILTIRLHIPQSNSLKAKRQVIKSLKDRLRNNFNVSVSEVDSHDKWQLADIAIATVSSDKAHCNSALSNVLNFIESIKGASLIDHSIELI